MKKGVLIINLGTPDSPEVSDVAKYLKEFLNDGRVIDVPKFQRTLLVNGLIIPRRKKNSAAIYKRVWTDKGSPLLLYGIGLVEKVQAELGEGYSVKLGMRYQSPSLESVLNEFKDENISSLVILPLYPQHASSSTGSTLEEVSRIMSKWEVFPDVNMISDFHNEDGYIQCIANRAKDFDLKSYDTIFFSYHGLPVRHIDKVHTQIGACDGKCEVEFNPANKYCYKAACFETTRLVAKKLGLTKEDYQVVFQSGLGKQEWIRPYAEETLVKEVKNGSKNNLFFSPAFAADCLETLDEIGVEFHEACKENGGEKVDLVPSLNDGDDWVQFLGEYIKRKSN
jgi:ferrochelatase